MDKGDMHSDESQQPEYYVDPVTEVYKKDVDRTMIRENLKLTVEERIRKLESMMRFVDEARRAMKAAKGSK
jgi:hypothetical protein